MARSKSANPYLKPNNDTGFGSNPNSYGGRFINKDGSFNVKREGIRRIDKFSMYQRMLHLPVWKFSLLILFFYFGINVLFTLAYMAMGRDQLQGFVQHTLWGQVRETFYFSTQTFVTVGYGRINPVGDAANVLASIESMVGLLSFAIVTGLLYGRFSRPKANLVFSEHALISPYRDHTAFMFRFVNYKDHHILTNVEIKVNLSLLLEENGVASYQFYELPLERTKIDNLSVNWTVVHAIDEGSPLFGFTATDLENADMEVYVLVTGFDDIYANSVLQRTSYTYRELKFGSKFVPMYRESVDAQMTILELNKLNSVVTVGA